MILALRDFQLLLGGEQPPNLFERLRRDDEIGLLGAAHRDFHLGQPMTVGCDHAHQFTTKLPEYAVQNGPALLGARRERRVTDQLLQLARRNPHRLLEMDRREARELGLRQTQQPELRPAALEGDALVTSRGDLHRCRRQLARNLAELPGRDRDCSCSLDICRDFRAHSDVQIGP